jgi:hypothetical protein
MVRVLYIADDAHFAGQRSEIERMCGILPTARRICRCNRVPASSR